MLAAPALVAVAASLAQPPCRLPSQAALEELRPERDDAESRAARDSVAAADIPFLRAVADASSAAEAALALAEGLGCDEASAAYGPLFEAWLAGYHEHRRALLAESERARVRAARERERTRKGRKRLQAAAEPAGRARCGQLGVPRYVGIPPSRGPEPPSWPEASRAFHRAQERFRSAVQTVLDLSAPEGCGSAPAFYAARDAQYRAFERWRDRLFAEAAE